MELRRLGKSDFRPQYFALLRQLTSCNDDRISKNSFDQFIDSLSPFHQIWVLEENGRIVGTGTLLVEQKIIHDMGKVGHIEDIVIDNMCRGVGLGEKAEKACSEVLEKDRFTVTVDLQDGLGNAEVYTSDLSVEYVKINADYRT